MQLGGALVSMPDAIKVASTIDALCKASESWQIHGSAQGFDGGGAQGFLLALTDRLPMLPIHGADGSVYLERYTLADLSNHGHVYINRFLRPDEDLELHGHPWAAMSFVLLGSFREERRTGAPPTYGVTTIEHHAGEAYIIADDDYHRVELITQEVWTLFVTGPHLHSWAFWDRTSGRYTPQREFIESKGLIPYDGFSTPHDKAQRCLALADRLPPGDPGADRLRTHARDLIQGAST